MVGKGEEENQRGGGVREGGRLGEEGRGTWWVLKGGRGEGRERKLNTGEGNKRK